MRVEKIKDFMPMRVLTEADLHPTLLSSHMEQMLARTRRPGSAPLDLDGARQAARYLMLWADETAK